MVNSDTLSDEDIGQEVEGIRAMKLSWMLMRPASLVHVARRRDAVLSG